jgi:hypothetical protein
MLTRLLITAAIFLFDLGLFVNIDRVYNVNNLYAAAVYAGIGALTFWLVQQIWSKN